MPLRRIAVIGAGTAGLDLALRCARAGFEVTLEDVMPSRLRHARELASDLSTNPGAPSSPAASSPAKVGSHPHPHPLRLVSTVHDAVRDADLAIDFLPDELESKLEIFSMFDRMAPPHTILCTPTALSIADLASCTYRPELCFALRSPTPGLAPGPLTLISTARSSPPALTAVQRWLQTLGFEVTPEQDHVPLP